MDEQTRRLVEALIAAFTGALVATIVYLLLGWL